MFHNILYKWYDVPITLTLDPICDWSAYGNNNLYIINDHNIYTINFARVAPAYDFAHSLFVGGDDYEYLHVEKWSFLAFNRD